MTSLPGDVPARRRPATMRDVAALAGVGLKTVSRVVNGEPGVSPELAVRVLDAVRLLDYRHNLTASSLRRADRKTATIGLLLEDVSNPYSSALHRAVEDVARARNTLVFAGSSDEEPERQREMIAALVARQVDGLIVVPTTQDPGDLVRQRQLGLPIVLVDRLTSLTDADSVTADNQAGAGVGVRHLLDHGHRRVAFLGDLRTIWTAGERYRGYVGGLAAAGVPVVPELVVSDLRNIAAAAAATERLLCLPDPPTALFAGQNLVTIGVLSTLKRLGLHRRIAVVGFDDFLLADLLDPAVTVVAQDPGALGRTAADRLFARVDGDLGPPRHVVVPTRLIVRGSGEIPPLRAR